MMVRLTPFCLCAGLVAALGCQNPLLSRREPFGDRGGRDSFESRFSFSSDDPAAMESGRGHSSSLASELADRRHRDDFQEASRTSGGSASAIGRLMEQGYDADAHGRTQDAKKAYEQVLFKQPDHAEAHHRLAILADRAGEYSSAEKHYEIALRGKPNDADLLNDLGYSYFLQGRAVESERYLTKALERNPQHAARQGKSVAALRSGQGRAGFIERDASPPGPNHVGPLIPEQSPPHDSRRSIGPTAKRTSECFASARGAGGRYEHSANLCSGKWKMPACGA